MTRSYLTDAGTARTTPQSEPIPGSSQVPNEAGGHAWEVGPLRRLERFLILGTEGGSYYAGERKMTRAALDGVRTALREHDVEAVDLIADVSESGRAPRNDEAIYALALAASLPDTADEALDALPQVCRTGAHLFTFCDFVQRHRGWGPALKRAVARWYTDKDAADLAYQLVKYRQREGWTHADVLRLAKPRSVSGTTPDEATSALLTFATGRETELGVRETDSPALEAYRRAQEAATPRKTADLVREYGGALPWEALRPEHLNEPEVIEALVPAMPIGALTRQLGRMSAAGALRPMAELTRLVTERLTDPDAVRGSRLHPVAILNALMTYGQGHGDRGRLTWEPAAEVVDALDAAFYMAFENVEPTGARTLLACDVSGSMWGRGSTMFGLGYGGFPNCTGMPNMPPALGAAAMALAQARSGDPYHAVAFADGMRPFELTARQRLGDVLASMFSIPMGGTDCALPMLWAAQEAVEVDHFVIYTDSQTWAGRTMHPAQALERYRRGAVPEARLTVVAMVGNEFSIGDPDDSRTLDVVGFDAAAPRLIAEFGAGRL